MVGTCPKSHPTNFVHGSSGPQPRPHLVLAAAGRPARPSDNNDGKKIKKQHAIGNKNNNNTNTSTNINTNINTNTSTSNDNKKNKNNNTKNNTKKNNNKRNKHKNKHTDNSNSDNNISTARRPVA